MDPEVLRQLQRSRLFINVDMKQLETDIDACSVLTLAQGAVLLQPDVLNLNIYFLISGELIVTYDPVEMDAIARLKPSDCVGEVSFLDKNPPTAYVVAAVDCQVLEVPEERMWHMLKRGKDFPFNMLELLVERFREKNDLLKSGLTRMRHYQTRSEMDALTGMYNRSWCEEVFPRQIDLCARAEQSVSLAMLDMDHFKQINDYYGHVAGDSVLQQVAALIRSQLRITDLAARYGGEEFIVMLPTAAVHEVVEKLDSLRQHVQDAEFRLPDGHSIRCTVSIGVAEWRSGLDLHTLMVIADKALYRAKHNGRNQVALERRGHDAPLGEASDLSPHRDRRKPVSNLMVFTA